MLQKAKTFITRPGMSRLLVVIAIMAVAALSMATTTGEVGTNDWTGSIDDFKDDWGQMLVNNGPSLMGVMVLGLGFGFVWRKVRQGAKSS